MTPLRFDLIIIGTGAGGGTMLHALAPTGARILVIERGDTVPREDHNWDPVAVWKDLRYRTTEHWFDEHGEPFVPYMHYGVGGNTKFWGSVLYRLRREDFGALGHLDGVSPAWPIDYDTLAPYYDRAEQIYGVRGEAGADPTDPPRGPFPHPPVPHAPGMQRLVEEMRRMGLRPAPLPLGLLRPGDEGGCVRVEAVEVDRDGERLRVEAPLVVVSCGAANSAALLLRSATDRHPHGLANSSGLVGRRYMAHLATMMQGFHPFRHNDTVFQKTVAINDYYFGGPSSRHPLGPPK